MRISVICSAVVCCRNSEIIRSSYTERCRSSAVSSYGVSHTHSNCNSSDIGDGRNIVAPCASAVGTVFHGCLGSCLGCEGYRMTLSIIFSAISFESNRFFSVGHRDCCIFIYGEEYRRCTVSRLRVKIFTIKFPCGSMIFHSLGKRYIRISRKILNRHGLSGTERECAAVRDCFRFLTAQHSKGCRIIIYCERESECSFGISRLTGHLFCDCEIRIRRSSHYRSVDIPAVPGD